MPRFEHAGVTLHYEAEPHMDAPWLVLSNSLGTQLAMWDAQRPAFRRNFSLLRYDGRGHGSSSPSPTPCTMEQLGDDVIALADHLGIECFHFCGLSLGGMVGQWLAVERPERIEKLVLASTAAKIGTAASWNERIRSIEANGMSAVVDGILERWLTAGFRSAHPEAETQIRSMLLAMHPSSYTANCAAVRDFDLSEAVSAITAPTLVIYGTEDPSITAEDAHFLTSAIPRSQTLALPAAHLSNIEQAEAFTSGVLRFLAGPEAA